MSDSGDKRDLLRGAFASRGVDWDRAIDFGVDVSVLLDRLNMSPEERLLELDRTAQFVAELQGGLLRGDATER